MEIETITHQQWWSYARRVERANLKQKIPTLSFTSISTHCRSYIVEVQTKVLIVKIGWRQAMKAVRP